MSKRQKVNFMKPYNKVISSKWQAFKSPLFFLKCLTGQRFQGILLDDEQPRFLEVFDLAPADVLFCSASKQEIFHRVISFFSSGNYAHVAIYTGDGKVIEAMQKGVVQDTLDNVISRYPYIAVCRSPGAKPTGIPNLSKDVVDYCKEVAENKIPFSNWGAIKSPTLEFFQNLKHLIKPHLPFKKTKQKTKPYSGFFCSELVIEAYKHGGYLGNDNINSSNYSPSALAESNFFYLIGYLGNPILAEHILKNDYFLTGGVS